MNTPVGVLSKQPRGANPLLIHWLGRTPYAEGLAVQEAQVRARQLDRGPDALFLMEHPPVITLGRGANPGHVLLDAHEAAAHGIEVRETGRGGDVTFHGPGQLVGYPVLALRGKKRDAHRYLRDLEEAMILASASFGVRARRCRGLTGVWVGNRKLAAIGVRISTGWITSHGFALNVTTDLSSFDAIVPCGIRGMGVTSLAEVTGLRYSLEEVVGVVSARVAQVLDLHPVVLPGPE